MPVWERYAAGYTLTALGDHANTALFVNDVTNDNFQQADIVCVDGILTLHSDTDNLCGFRLIVASNLIVTGDLTEDTPTPDDSMVWYSFFAARGPMVFRLRSKKTIPPNHSLWLQAWKAVGTDATILRYGLQVLFVLKH